METFLRRGVRAASILTGLVLLLTAGTSIAYPRQDDRPRTKAWLGVSITDVSESVAKENKLADESGAYVTDVADDSPADSAGIEEHDIIVEFGQNKIADADDLVKAVGKFRAGDKVTVIFVRKGAKKSVEVVLAKFPHMRMPRVDVNRIIRGIRVFSDRGAQGMRLMELNDQLGEYFGVPKGTGVLVEKVRKGSAAEKAGIKAGDVLLRIGSRTIDDMEDVSKAFSRYDEGDKVEVEISRKGTTKKFSLEIKEDRRHPSFRWFGPDNGGMYHRPPFEENFRWTPRGDGRDYQFDIQEFHPDMEILRKDLQEMKKSLKDQQENLLKSIRNIHLRSI